MSEKFFHFSSELVALFFGQHDSFGAVFYDGEDDCLDNVVCCFFRDRFFLYFANDSFDFTAEPGICMFGFVVS